MLSPPPPTSHLPLSPPSTPHPPLFPPSTDDSCSLLGDSFHSNFTTTDCAKDDTLTISVDNPDALDTPASQPAGEKKLLTGRTSDYIDVEKMDEVPGPVEEVIDEGIVGSVLKEIAAHTCSFCGDYFMNLEPFNEHLMTHFYPVDPFPRSPSSEQELSLKMVNRTFFKKQKKGGKMCGSVEMSRQHFDRKAIQVGKKPVEPTVVKKKRSHKSRGPHVYPATGNALESLKEELQLDMYRCLDCGVEFVTSRSLRNHMDRYKHVMSAVSRPTRRTARLDPLSCLRCDKDFVTPSALLHHSRTLHKMNV